MVAHCSNIRRTNKWYIRLFFHLVTDLCMLNAEAVCEERVRNVTFAHFKMKVYGSYIPSEMALRPSTNRVLETTEKRVRFIECCRKLAEEENSANARQKLSECIQGAVCVRLSLLRMVQFQPCKMWSQAF
ncbi:hypothetical protein KIN20_008784 [Parelaphostrongylus tenuis]|uniref:PiggyBac transposable element-derived protein domain-containing protein n=1 Tax=Parelaphostrongylus tenuis TaxID=148309 RepID=A0AAD5MX22_PARTN|nr:hypothetical protein KIN20_008784 [Parelaphostrongylus tenuis]